MAPRKDPGTPAAPIAAPKPAAGSGDAVDLDARAAKRGERDYVIGGVTLHRRRKTYAVTRSVDEIAARQQTAVTKLVRLSTERSAAEPDEKSLAALDAADRIATIESLPPVEKVLRLDGEIRTLGYEVQDLTFELVAALLQHADGSEVPVELLMENLDDDDMAELSAALTGGGEPAAGPTETASS